MTGAEEIIAGFVQLKAINNRGYEGLAPLHYAALYDQQAIAEKLLAHGTDFHCQTEVAKKESEELPNVPIGSKALQIAEQNGHQEMAYFLLGQGANT
ncbi:MAG: ankyrin repeat domain-containing protein [Mariprofundus sp.]